MRYKRIFAAVTAFCLLFCGCQKIEQPESSGSTQETAATQETAEVTPIVNDTLTTTAKRETITLPEEMNYYGTIEPTADGFRSFTPDEDSVMHLYEFSTDFAVTSDCKLVPPASHDGYYYIGGVYALGEDAMYSLSVMENHSNMEPYREDMENYDWDAYHAAWESEYLLCTYAADGTLASTVPVEGLEDYRLSQSYDQFTQLYAGDGVFWLTLMDGRILKITPDGTLEEAYVPELQGDDSVMWTRILHDRDGKTVYLQTISGTAPEGYSTSKVTLSEFDAKTGSVSEPFCIVEEDGFISFSSSLCSGGSGNYRLFVTTENALCGIRDDGTMEEVINWEASDLSRMGAIPLEDGTFLGAAINENGQTEWYHLTRKTVSETQQEERIITIGAIGKGEGISDFVREFNQSRDDMRVKIIPYMNSDGTSYGDPAGTNDALQNFKLDIISDNAPDIILMYNSHESIIQLGKRGAFADLYELMEGDAEVNTETVLPNIRTAMESENGALYALPQAFGVATAAVKTRICDKENWTVDDMIELYDGAESVQYKWMSQTETLEMLLYGSDFIDFAEGTCSFDSPDFLKILEFCSRYPESAGPPPKTDDPASWERVDAYYGEMYRRYQRDEDYLCVFGLDGIGNGIASDYSYTRYGELAEEMTLVGYPSDNGKGGKLIFEGELAISSACDDTEAAWEFVKAMLIEQGDTIISGYPVLETQFETSLDDEMYIRSFEEQRSDEEFYEDNGMKIYPLTQEERDDLEDYIRSCDTVLSMNDDVLNIVLEEAEMYFAGDLSAEDAAERIQSRAEILVSEQS